jgi:hypothetical protein
LYFDLIPLEHDTGSLTNVFIILGAVAAAIVAVAVVMRIRGKKPRKEEDDVRLP